MHTSQKYKANFFAFMSSLDGMNYSPLDNNITFSQEGIVLITYAHVASFLLYTAYGDGYQHLHKSRMLIRQCTQHKQFGMLN